MQKIPYNAALALLLSLGLSACSINTGKGSQGDTTARTSASSLIATTTADSSSADNTSSDNTASNNANNMGSNDSTNATDSSRRITMPQTVTAMKNPIMMMTRKAL